MSQTMPCTLANDFGEMWIPAWGWVIFGFKKEVRNSTVILQKLNFTLPK